MKLIEFQTVHIPYCGDINSNRKVFINPTHVLKLEPADNNTTMITMGAQCWARVTEDIETVRLRLEIAYRWEMAYR